MAGKALRKFGELTPELRETSLIDLYLEDKSNPMSARFDIIKKENLDKQEDHEYLCYNSTTETMEDY